MSSPISQAAEHAPAGFCPACGYRVNAGCCPECGFDVQSPAPRSPDHPRRRWLTRIALLLIGLLLVIGGRPALNWFAREHWPASHLRAIAQGDSFAAAWAEQMLELRAVNVDREELTNSEQREARIQAELSQRDPITEWAGVYEATGPAVGATLAIAPRSGFVERHFEGFDHGEVRQVSPHRLCLRHTRGRRLGLPQHEEFVFVRWGERRMLVCADEMPGFCRFVDGGEIRGRHVFRHRRDAAKPCGPVAEVPSEFKPLLHPLRCAAVLKAESPVETLVVSPLDLNLVQYRYECLIDRGSDDDVCPGQPLRALFGEFDTCEVISAERHVSRVRCQGALLDDDVPHDYTPAPGWLFNLLDELTPCGADQVSLDDDSAPVQPPTS